MRNISRKQNTKRNDGQVKPYLCIISKERRERGGELEIVPVLKKYPEREELSCRQFHKEGLF